MTARPTAGSIPTGWLRTAGPESGGAAERMRVARKATQVSALVGDGMCTALGTVLLRKSFRLAETAHVRATSEA
jgi:hypothetical protein